MSRERADFSDIDIPDFKPRAPKAAMPDPAEIRTVAERNGFTTQHATPPAPAPAAPFVDARSLRRTNRTAKLNIATTEDTRNRFWAMAHRLGSTSGEEVLLQMMSAFERELSNSNR